MAAIAVGARMIALAHLLLQQRNALLLPGHLGGQAGMQLLRRCRLLLELRDLAQRGLLCLALLLPLLGLRRSSMQVVTAVKA